MKIKHIILVSLYSLLLPLHIANSITILGGIKLFYIPVMLLAVYNLLHVRRYSTNKTVRYIEVIGLLAIVPVIIFNASVNSHLTYALIILALIGLPYIDKRYIYLLAPPLILLANVISYRYADWVGFPYRYQGLYNDPNYLVISQLVGIYLCLKAIESYKNVFVKIVAVISILVSLYIILITQSRGGILALCLFVLVYLIKIYKKNKKYAFVLCVVLLIGGGYSYGRMKVQIDRVIDRFVGDNESDVGAANSRLVEISKAFDGIMAEPFYLLFGAGISASGGEESRYDNEHRIHNTPVALLYENGLLALLLFFIAVWMHIKFLFKSDMLSCALVLSIVLQSMTIWTLIYLPFWLGFFLPLDCLEN